MNLPRLTAVAVLTAALSACSNSTQSLPATGNGAVAGNVAAPSAIALASWQSSLQQRGLPAAGCYNAVYPSSWQRVACGTPPKLWYPVPKSRRGKIGIGQNVGDGRDFTIDTTPHVISTAIGAFPKVSGVTSVDSVGCCGEGGVNSYTLQLNSNFFQSAACGTLKNCAGWSQFVYENPPGSGQGALFIQDWLVPTSESGFSSCPPGKGWQNTGFGCVQNSPGGVNTPNISITDMGQMTETGVAASSGDSVYLTDGKSAYGMKNVQSDGITDLSVNWMGAEFNAIGNAGGDTLNFNSGSKVTVSIEANDGVKTKPTCPANSGTTGEANNLFFTKAPPTHPKLQYPSILFAMSSKAGKTASCDTMKGS
jgi:hypothetical protein